MAGGNGTVGTISSSGLYTPPSRAGTHTVTATNSGNAANTLSASVALTDLSAITTWHNDIARTGQNLQEYALTPTTVWSGNFGKRWSCQLDGNVYAQPLYVGNLSIGGGIHKVLFVANHARYDLRLRRRQSRLRHLLECQFHQSERRQRHRDHLERQFDVQRHRA